ncbi:MAG TPA: hypothetical protein VLA52_01410 [Thermohalobaculum sp.]|nr:hypothetical protein [Thermohalobaculum sp.]
MALAVWSRDPDQKIEAPARPGGGCGAKRGVHILHAMEQLREGP